MNPIASAYVAQASAEPCQRNNWGPPIQVRVEKVDTALPHVVTIDFDAPITDAAVGKVTVTPLGDGAESFILKTTLIAQRDSSSTAPTVPVAGNYPVYEVHVPVPPKHERYELIFSWFLPPSPCPASLPVTFLLLNI